MKIIIGVCAFFLLAFSAHSLAEVKIHAQSSNNNVDLTLDPANGNLKDSLKSPSSVTAIDSFVVRDGTLFHNGQPSLKVTELLAQGAADGTDIAIVRVESLALGNPLAFLAGHPKQVSKIVAAGFRGGQLVWQRRIAKEAYSGKWRASIASSEA